MAPLIDAVASEQHILAHLLPIWDALPADRRGDLYLAPKLEHDGPRRPLTEVDDRPGRAILTMRHGDLVKARKGGRTRIALGQHGAGQSYTAPRRGYPGGDDQHDVGLFLVPNDHARVRTLQRYPDARVATVGCPRLDSLPRREGRASTATVAISFHWNGGHIAPELIPAFRWYRGTLPALARRVDLIGHAHPRFLRDAGPSYRRLGIEIVADFDDVLRRADLYACDNSSSLFEFASTGRPVVVLNHPKMRRDVPHGLRFWEAATVGLQVDAATDLIATVERALQDPPDVAAAREAALDVVYQPRSGGAALAAEALTAWANGLKPS